MHALYKILINVDLTNTNKMEEIVKQLKLNLAKDISEFKDVQGILLESERITSILEKSLIATKFQQEQINDDLLDTVFVISNDSIYTIHTIEITKLLHNVSAISKDILDIKHYIVDFNDDSLLQKMRESSNKYALVLMYCSN